MNRILRFLGSLFFFFSLTQTGLAEERVGTKPGSFLNSLPGAQQWGMGQTGVSLQNASHAMEWNPAGLTYAKQAQVALSRSFQLESINDNHMALAFPYNKRVGVGLSATYFDYGSFNETNDVGASVGDVEANDWSVSLGLGFKWKRLQLGVAGKYINSTIVNSASTAAGDVGLQYFMSPLKTNFGAVVKNIGGKLKFDKEEKSLSQHYRAGVSRRFWESLTLSLEAQDATDQKAAPAGGLEYDWSFGSNRHLFFRAGYNQTQAADLDGLAGATLGFGLQFKMFKLDYAWIPLGDLGQNNLLTLELSRF